MPRSESRIADDRAAKARCRELITRASKSYTGNIDAGAIVRHIQWHYSKQVEADRPLARYLWGKGLEPEVRSVLREWDTIGSSEEQPAQLDLFPAHERPIVRQVNRARIWSPSAGAHVQYHAADPEVIEESGRYYINHGEGEIKTGNLLLQLAAMRRQTKAA